MYILLSHTATERLYHHRSLVPPVNISAEGQLLKSRKKCWRCENNIEMQFQVVNDNNYSVRYRDFGLDSGTGQSNSRFSRVQVMVAEHNWLLIRV